MKTEELLSMLAVQDEQDEEKNKERLDVKTRSFDSVLRIAEIIDAQPGIFNGDENYFEALARSFLTTDPNVPHLLTDLKNLGISIPRDIAEKAQKDLGGFVSLLSKELKDRLDKIPKTKIPALPGTNHAGKRGDFYQTDIGMFLPQNIDSLIAANFIKQSINGLEGVLEKVSDFDSLSRLLFLNKLINLAPEARRRGIYRELQGLELSQDALIYTALSLDRETNVLSQIQTLRGLSVARVKANLITKARLKKVARTEIDYKQRAEDVIYKIYQSTGRINVSYQNVSDKKTFDEFIKGLESKIMSDECRAFKPENKDELTSGKAILVRTMKGLKSGTLGELVSGQFKPSKGNVINISPKDVVKIERKKLEGKLVILDERPQIGELVVMNDQANGYGCTKEGSYGYLIEYLGEKAKIEFHHLTGNSHPIPVNWYINIDTFKKAVFKKEEIEQEDVKYTPRVSDKVRIKPASRHAGQNKNNGEIISIDPFNQELPYIVKFQDGYQNQYSAEDLDVLNVSPELAKLLRDKNKQQRIKKKQLKVERNRVRKTIQQSLEDIASCEEQRGNEVKGCVEHFVKLGITPEIASFVVKYHLDQNKCNYEAFIKQGALIPSEESKKSFQRINDLIMATNDGPKNFLMNLFNDIDREMNVFVDLSNIKVQTVNDVQNLRERLSEIYTKSYVRDNRTDLTKGYVLVSRGTNNGFILKMDKNIKFCEECKAYHIGDDTGRIRRDQLVSVKPAEFYNTAGLMKGARVMLGRDGERAHQHAGVGILQDNYQTGEHLEHRQVIFEDGYMNFYRKQDLDVLSHDENKAYLARQALPKLNAIFDKHFKALEPDVSFHSIIADINSQLSSLGFSDEAVRVILSAQIPDYKNLI